MSLSAPEASVEFHRYVDEMALPYPQPIRRITRVEYHQMGELGMFDDEWFTNVFAASIVDGEGGADDRTARLCASFNTSVYNAARCGGTNIPDNAYNDRDSYMPPYNRPPKRRNQPQEQSWGEIRKALGF